MTQTFERPTLEDYLGPGATRFFGGGYRRIREHVQDLALDVRADGSGTVAAAARVRFPADWSVKNRGEIPPHLSTIDALVIAARLAEFYVSAAYGLDAAQRRRMWLRRVDVRAGTDPTEEGFEGLPAVAAAQPAAPTDDAGPGAPGYVTVLRCRIARMSVRCEVVHDAGVPVPQSRTLSTAEELLGPLAARPYGDGYRHRTNAVRELAVDLAALAVEGRVSTDLEPGTAAPGNGLEGLYQPTMTYVDLFVVGLQFGQILLYGLDGVSRADSQTLWMRRTTFTSRRPRRRGPEPVPVRTKLVEPMQVADDQGLWRTADIVTETPGASMRCLVSHLLPPGTRVDGRS